MPDQEHAHLQCRGCDETWEIEASDAAACWPRCGSGTGSSATSST